MTISPISPAGLRSSSLKEEITAIWSQVQARVVQLGGGDVANLRPDMDVESVLSLLDRAQQQEEFGGPTEYVIVKQAGEKDLQSRGSQTGDTQTSDTQSGRTDTRRTDAGDTDTSSTRNTHAGGTPQ